MIRAPIFAARPMRRPPARRVATPKADLNESIAITGKFLGLFVLFTSSMNWWHYKRVREEREREK